MSKDKDAAFFDAFASHAATSVEATKLLARMLEGCRTLAAPAPYQLAEAVVWDADRTTIAALGRQVKDAESRGDRITHDTVKRLRENWITPLDRADIHTLISRLDDVLDLVEAAAERIVLFEVDTAPPEAAALVVILVKACEALVVATGLLRSMKNAPQILEACVEVNRYENEADALYRTAIADMFRAGNDPLLVMKWRDIFDSLESAADCCEDAANVIEGVVLEYA